MPGLTEKYKITNRQSSFFNQIFVLEERIEYRDGSVSLWLIHPKYGTLSFPSTDAELVEVLS